MKKEGKNWILGAIAIIVITVAIVFAINSYLEKKEIEKGKTEIKSIRVVDVSLINSASPEQEYNACLLCKGGGICPKGSLKLSFQLDTPSKYISCNAYDNGVAKSLGYSTAYNGMNVYPVFRDYSKSPQKYKVCCIYTFSKIDSPVCSEEYTYQNPC